MGFIKATGIVALVAVLIASLGGTFKLGSQNGVFDLVNMYKGVHNPVLPGTQIPMKTDWTGINAIDAFMGALLTFFWPVIEGKNINLSLLSIHFYGQAVSLYMLMHVESHRLGNEGLALSYITVMGILLENTAMGVLVPVYGILHLLTSRTLSSRVSVQDRATELLVQPKTLSILPWAVMGGLVLPTLGMIIGHLEPTEPIWKSLQFWIVARQAHPVLTLVLGRVLALLPIFNTPKFRNMKSRNAHCSRESRKVYSVATWIGAVPHIAVLSLTIGMAYFAEPSGIRNVSSLPTLETIFRPTAFWMDIQKVATIAEGCQQFFQWDEFGAVIGALIWAFAVNQDGLQNESRGPAFICTLLKTLFLAVMAGPAAAAIALIRDRDEVLLELSSQERQKTL